jgi:hypothetical protein
VRRYGGSTATASREAQGMLNVPLEAGKSVGVRAKKVW